MANIAVKVAVVEGDFASLVGLGFPLSLSLHLQEKSLRLSQANWTAKSTSGGFSISLFWPAPDPKSQAKPRRRRTRKRRPKASIKPVPAACAVARVTSNPPKPSTVVLGAIATTPTLINANHHPKSSQYQSQCDKDGNKSDSEGKAVNEENKKCDDDNDNEEKTDFEAEEGEWTQVSRRKKVHLPPCWKLRFPVHMRAGLHTPSRSSSNSSEECFWLIPCGSEDDI